MKRREPAGGERPRSPPPNERDRTGTRGRGSRRVGRRRAVARALAPGCGSCPAPRLVGRLADKKAWARLGLGNMGEVSDCLCPPHAGRPRHLSRREETLDRLHAGRLAYLISRRPPPNLASPPQQKGFPGPRNASRKRVDPWDPAEPKALARAPPARSCRRARPPDLPAECQRGNPQGRPSPSSRKWDAEHWPLRSSLVQVGGGGEPCCRAAGFPDAPPKTDPAH